MIADEAINPLLAFLAIRDTIDLVELCLVLVDRFQIARFDGEVEMAARGTFPKPHRNSWHLSFDAHAALRSRKLRGICDRCFFVREAEII